jgi:hypothetical protein
MVAFVMLFMSMEWNCVSELGSPTGLLFIPQMIFDYGEPWWSDADRGKLKNLEKNLSQCDFAHHKSPGAKPDLRGEAPAITA